MTSDSRLEQLVERLTLLAAMNTLMVQTQFLTVERLRVASQVVDENVSNEFAARLMEQCEKLVAFSDAELEAVLSSPTFARERKDTRESLLQLLAMRREFASKIKEVKEKKREVENLERMYR